MPVSAQRTSHTESVATITQFGTLTFTGTYTTGGVPLNPSTIPGGPGTSSIGGTFLWLDTMSPMGYTYVLSGTGAAAKIKIFSGTTELANAAAFPDATVPFKLESRKG